MDFIKAVSLFFILISAQQIQLSSCRPFGPWGRRTGPNPIQGVGCPRTPNYGEYCDKFGSSQIKWCSPCNVDQLRSSDIAFPEECANLPCPYRCPYEISDRASPAPNDTCDVTTTSFTTTDATTVLPTTVLPSTTAAATPTSTATETLKEAPPGSTTTQPDEPTKQSKKNYLVLYISIGLSVIVIVICVIAAYQCIKKCKREKADVTPSSSTQPMIASSSEIEMTPPQTPSSPLLIPRQNSVAVTTNECDVYMKLDCDCAEARPIHIGSEGAELEGLSPSTNYHVLMGTIQGDVFHTKYSKAVVTLGEMQPDLSKCFTLHNIKGHIESNPGDFQYLKKLFGHIGDETAQDLNILRGLSKALGVASLGDSSGRKLFEEMLALDSQLKAEEDSVKSYSILQALGVHVSAQAPDYVIEISRKLSSIHQDCLPCRHQVCQLTRNSRETFV